MALLFEYAVILDEKRDKDGDVTQAAELLVEPTHLLATNQAQAEMIAARAIPEIHLDNLDRIKVVVRPF